MNSSRREVNRIAALAAAVSVVGVPLALIATTWQPLEPAARGSDEEEDSEVPEDEVGEQPRTRERRGRKDRERDGEDRSSTPTE